MCGINFILDKKEALDLAPIERMTRSNRHRGPDHSEIRRIRSDGADFFFGANRLKVVDLSDRANQPFVSDDGNYALLYNGEIYNFYELKNELIRKGHRFKSATDTEALFYLLVEEGEEAIHKLKGMFAFVFFEKAKNKILAARDRFGMKPLFYAENDHFLIISSEIKGVLSSGLINKELNEDQIPHYLKFRFARKPFTFFKNIYELTEGHCIKKIGEKKTDIRPFGKKTLSPDRNVSATELVERTEELLYDALLRHVVADPSCGLFLSGGVDSTLALALLRRGNIHLPTFSVTHEESAGSFGSMDSYYSRKAVQKYGASLDHHEIAAGPDLMDKLEEFIGRLDQPIGDSALLLTDMLASYAANSVKIVLSGAGADELFGGYNRHWAYYKYLAYYAGFSNNLKAVKKLASFLPTGFDHPYRKNFNLAKKFAAGLDSDRLQTFINFTALNLPVNTPSDIQEMPDETDYLHAALQYDRRHYLISDVLAVNDRMSMQHSIEMRMPYLDDDLTDFIDTIDPARLIKKGRKWILKDILNNLGGGEFCRRAKEGFGAPFGQWLRLRELKRLEYQFTKEHKWVKKFIAPEVVGKLYTDHIQKKADNSLELWSYLVLVKWLDQEFK